MTHLTIGKTVMVTMINDFGDEEVWFGELLSYPQDTGDCWYISRPNGVEAINPLSPRLVSIFQRDDEEQVDGSKL